MGTSDKRRPAKLDPQIGRVMAAYCDRRGVQQQHFLSAAVFLHLAMPNEARALVDRAYAQWIELGAPCEMFDAEACDALSLVQGEETSPFGFRLDSFRLAIQGAIDNSDLMSLAEWMDEVVGERRGRQKARKDAEAIAGGAAEKSQGRRRGRGVRKAGEG